MKKIVALVLSLVMVLGLATTAFGASAAYYGDNLATLGKHANCKTDVNTYTLEAYTAGNAVAKTFDKVAIWETNKLTGAKTLVATYVVTTADSAQSYFVDGSTITYLDYTAGQANANTYAGVVTAVPTVDKVDVEKCGDMFAVNATGDVAVYTDADGVFYVENKTSGTAYNVDGKLVKLVKKGAVPSSMTLTATEAAIKAQSLVADTVYVVAHDYDCDYTTFNGDKTVTKVYCADCDAEFAFVAGTNADAIAKFGAGNYLPTALADDAGTVYVSLVPGASAPVAGTTTEKVESAQTFDAGIAMYVGMSVMAAAGSAVVLKKKD